MKSHHFIGNFNLDKDYITVKDEELLNQIKNVLRLKKGEEVVLCDGNLNEAKALIFEMGGDFIEFHIIDRQKNQNEAERFVTLFCSILKRENFELVVQKATEAGVKEITPIITERTVKLNIRPDRLEKIIKEAAEQSDRGMVPLLNNVLELEESIIKVKNDLNLFLDKSGSEIFKDASRLEYKGRINIWVGPEGGWTPQEIDLARSLGFKVIKLGNTTLRAETAAIIGSYLAIHNS